MDTVDGMKEAWWHSSGAAESAQADHRQVVADITGMLGAVGDSRLSGVNWTTTPEPPWAWVHTISLYAHCGSRLELCWRAHEGSDRGLPPDKREAIRAFLVAAGSRVPAAAAAGRRVPERRLVL